jgi:undecaprenyl-diphosphatase
MIELVRRLAASSYAFARAEFAALLALLVVAGGVLAFIELADEMGEGDFDDFDRAVMLSLRQPTDVSQPIGPEWLVEAMVDITALGSTSVITLLTIFTTGFLLASRKYVSAAIVPVSVSGAAIAMDTLKALFERPRPDVVPHLVEVTSASFPSGHAMVATAAYLTLGVLMAEASRRSVSIYVMVCAISIALLVGFSRVYLGVHWPTDVLAGWCAGAAWAMGCWLLTYRVVERHQPKT